MDALLPDTMPNTLLFFTLIIIFKRSIFECKRTFWKLHLLFNAICLVLFIISRVSHVVNTTAHLILLLINFHIFNNSFFFKRKSNDKNFQAILEQGFYQSAASCNVWMWIATFKFSESQNTKKCRFLMVVPVVFL